MPVEEVANEFDITREAVIEACWYAGTYGITNTFSGISYGRTWRKRWKKWANENHPHMWSGDWHLVTHPPTK